MLLRRLDYLKFFHALLDSHSRCVARPRENGSVLWRRCRR
jgi:hypothetical protein